MSLSLVAWRNSAVAACLPPSPKLEPEAVTELPPNPYELLAAEFAQKEQDAYGAGRREGEAAATLKIESEMRAGVERLSATIAEVAGARNDAIRRAESDIVKLSVEIARRILHRELSLDNSALDALIRAALDKLRSQEVSRVRVYPGQEPMIRGCLQRLGRESTIEVVSDRSQLPGGAVFETSRGSLDASVDTQLREIERGLADQLGERS